MQLDNLTDWDATAVPGWQLNGQPQMTVVIKIGYRWNEQGNLLPLTAPDCPISYFDQYTNDDPDTCSIEQPSDIVPFKQNFEWLLKGRLQPNEQTARHLLSVRFQHAGLNQEKILYATGHRVWQKTLLGLIPSKPEPLVPCAIAYEHAFGGSTADNNKMIQYDANPIGTGYYKARNKSTKAPVPLPTFETKPFITSVKSNPEPAGFNAISPTWSPRSAYLEHWDAEAAAQGQCPYAPSASALLFNCAPADQQGKQPFKAGTQLTLSGFSPQPTQLELPDPLADIQLLQVTGQRIKNVAVSCDTLLIDTDQKTLAFVYRAALAWHPLNGPNSQLQLRHIPAAADGVSEARA